MGQLDYDYIFKVVVIGDKDVGKTSLLKRFAANTFSNTSIGTIGVDFLVKDFDIGLSKVKLELWDTAGEEKYRAVTSVYYRNADAVLIVFDLSRKETFRSIIHWMKEVQKQCGHEVLLILIGNKCDLEPQVKEDDIRSLTELHMIYWIEASAKDSTNVNEAFEILTRNLIERKNQLSSLISIDSGPGSLFLTHQEEKPPEGYCCSYI